jgi:hypothetical protein
LIKPSENDLLTALDFLIQGRLPALHSFQRRGWRQSRAGKSLLFILAHAVVLHKIDENAEEGMYSTNVSHVQQ